MNAKNVATTLTLSRLPIGLVTAWLLFRGSFTAAFVVFLAGQLTDILDGVIARRFKCESTWGREWDRRMDMALHLLTFVGYEAGALWVWGDTKVAGAPFGALTWIFAPTILLFERHSAASKLRSGLLRFVLVGFLIARLPPSRLNLALILATLVVGAYAAVYEIKQTIKEVETGKRRWFESPKSAAASKEKYASLPVRHLEVWRDDYRPSVLAADYRDVQICAEDVVQQHGVLQLVVFHVSAANGLGFMASIRKLRNGSPGNADVMCNGDVHYGIRIEARHDAQLQGEELLADAIAQLEARPLLN